MLIPRASQLRRTAPLCEQPRSRRRVARKASDRNAAEEWIKPGAFGTRSTLGVLVDEKANLLWVCSNDFSSAGVPGPSTVPGSYLKGFDLSSGEGKVSAELPGRRPSVTTWWLARMARSSLPTRSLRKS